MGSRLRKRGVLLHEGLHRFGLTSECAKDGRYQVTCNLQDSLPRLVHNESAV